MQNFEAFITVPKRTKMKTGIALSSLRINIINISFRIFSEVMSKEKRKAGIGIPSATEMTKHPTHFGIRDFGVGVGL